MPDAFESAVYVRLDRFDKDARDTGADQARDRRDDLRIGLVEMVSALRHLKEAGAWPSYMEELTKLAHDTISTRDAQLVNEIDAAGQHAEALDLTELNQIIAALS